eukprot:scaffold75221_cov16-Tisochrysis_lutea.AAC.1
MAKKFPSENPRSSSLPCQEQLFIYWSLLSPCIYVAQGDTAGISWSRGKGLCNTSQHHTPNPTSNILWLHLQPRKGRMQRLLHNYVTWLGKKEEGQGKRAKHYIEQSQHQSRRRDVFIQVASSTHFTARTQELNAQPSPGTSAARPTPEAPPHAGQPPHSPRPPPHPSALQPPRSLRGPSRLL